MAFGADDEQAACSALSSWPMPVARAAPAMPMAGTGPRPKIRMGSRRMLHTQPKISAAIVTFMRPTA